MKMIGGILAVFYNNPIDLSAETWVDLLTDSNITTEDDLRIFKLMYRNRNHEMRASEIASKLGISHHGSVNLQISRFSKRVIEKTNINPPLREDGKTWWWHVPFLGYEEGGKFPWILRPELAEALKQILKAQHFDNDIGLEEILDDVDNALPEGASKQILVNRYERNHQARNACISHYGYKCVVCGFDFGEVYGPVGKNKTHVHHLVPLSDVKQEYEVDPIEDLRPVCPNCHFIIHSTSYPFTIGELKDIIARNP